MSTELSPAELAKYYEEYENRVADSKRKKDFGGVVRDFSKLESYNRDRDKFAEELKSDFKIDETFGRKFAYLLGVIPSNNIDFSFDEGIISLRGKTYEVKDRIKNAGFRWDPDTKSWWIKPPLQKSIGKKKLVLLMKRRAA